MKILYKTLAILVIAGCSKQAVHTEEAVSIEPVNDTIFSLPDNVPDIQAAEESDTLLADKIEFLREETDRHADYGYMVVINSNGYESISYVTWLFDSTFLVKSYVADWANEGMEGKYEYFLNGRDLLCVYENESFGDGSTTVEYCKNSGGWQYEERDTDEPLKQPLQEDYLNSKEEQVNTYLVQLKKLLKESIISSTSDDIHKIVIENETDGYLETIEVQVPATLYAKLTEK